MAGDTLNVNNKAVQQNTYDAIVVGSGISGGWAANKQLAISSQLSARTVAAEKYSANK
ncbi:hypothetical protein QTN47_24895 [Danxiaibacter flavus]|uniref:FAD-binding protein n=1 Tax=Danxiaibacter flavus TaxID=3049108 RepID=A0ABV3ZPV0_9BACT|nr:hypothetical protein QNM32_24900 [Chitinophagaceae bacterium DXS]